MKNIKKLITCMLVLCLVLTGFPAFSMKARASEVEEETTINKKLTKGQQMAIDEANELEVPNAFIRHYFAEDYENGEINAPETELIEGETSDSVKVDISEKNTTAGYDGIEIKKVDTGVLARTKIDLGEYDFGDLKAGNIVYNMLAKKNLKGNAYLYFDKEEESTPVTIAAISIKRCADEDWEDTKNMAVDVRNAKISGKGRIYMVFMANSAYNDEGELMSVSGVKGNLYFESMFFTEGSTPVVDFDIDKEVNTIENINGSEKHTVTGYGNMSIRIPEGYVSEYTDKTLKDETYELDYIKGRGNSTWESPKKPYKVKLEKSSNLFGMGKSKHWVLLANYYDYSLMRNKFTYDLATKMGMKYTPKSVFVDVIMSGEYYGSYQLSQKIRVEKNSVNIDDLEDEPMTEEPGITGGYLMTMGESWLSENAEELTYADDESRFAIESPEYTDEYPEEAKEAQLNYLHQFFNELDAAVNMLIPKDDEENTDAQDEDEDVLDDGESESETIVPDGKTWRDYLDEQSFIDYFLVQEFSLNGDAYQGSSTYLYKERNGKLYWGPAWDFDYVAWDSTANPNSLRYEDFMMHDRCPWFATLAKNDSAFKEKLTERWELFKELLEDSIKDDGFIEKCKNELYYSALANYQVTTSTMMSNYDFDEGEGEYIYGDEGVVDDPYDDEEDDSSSDYVLNYTNEINKLKDYIRLRIDWVDENFDNIDKGPLPAHIEPVNFYVDGELYKTVEVDDESESISELPEAPKKDGYVFRGWFYKDFEDVEYKFDPESVATTYDEENEKTIPYDVYAKFVSEKDVIPVESISFKYDTMYVPLERDYTDYDEYAPYDEEGSMYSGSLVYPEKFLNIKPFNALADEIEWEVISGVNSEGEEVDPSDIAYVDMEGIYVINTGTATVQCKIGDKTATIKLVGFDSENVATPSGYSIIDNLNLKVNEYSDLDFKFNETEYIPYEAYTDIYFESLDSDILEVNNNGMVYAKKAGKTKVLVVVKGEDGISIKTANVNITSDSEGKEDVTESASPATPSASPVTSSAVPSIEPSTKPATESAVVKKPAKVTIKKINKKKKSAKKLTVKVKKISGVKGYQVAVYKTKKKANKNKNYIVRKFVKKNKFTIKNKKLKNNKKLFVKVRAYKLNGKTKVYGAWSKVSKVPVKK